MNTDDVYMKTIHVPIIIETDEDGVFIVSYPQFKGCHTFGKTIDEALALSMTGCLHSRSAWHRTVLWSLTEKILADPRIIVRSGEGR